ncbi:hypothetical protein [Eikenella sp. Marseille-P7795]|nr:hypothetical protein [Eikenella sp. Marseille-P7795]
MVGAGGFRFVEAGVLASLKLALSGSLCWMEGYLKILLVIKDG